MPKTSLLPIVGNNGEKKNSIHCGTTMGKWAPLFAGASFLRREELRLILPKSGKKEK